MLCVWACLLNTTQVEKDVFFYIDLPIINAAGHFNAVNKKGCGKNYFKGNYCSFETVQIFFPFVFETYMALSASFSSFSGSSEVSGYMEMPILTPTEDVPHFNFTGLLIAPINLFPARNAPSLEST